METSWQTVPLATLVESSRGISYGIVQPGSRILDGVPVIRVSDVRDGRVDTTSPLRVAKNIEEGHSRTRLKGGELLMTIVGTVGETAIVSRELVGWNVARAIAVLPINTDVGASWVQLAIRAPEVNAQIHSRLNTTVQATLNLRDLAQLPISLPPLKVRDGIMSILGALSDKIDLNRRINNTLEAMAQALFQEWFVDFGPVRAKAEGRQPEGLSAEVAALFPDALDEEGKPEGWSLEKLGESVELVRDMLLPTDYAEEKFAHFSLPAYDVGVGPMVDIGSSILSGKYILREGCILLSKLNPEISRVWMPDLSDYKRICSTEFLVCLPAKSASKEFLYCLFKSTVFKQHMEGLVTGTSKSHQRMTPSSFLNLQIIKSDSLVAAAFSSVTAPLLQRVVMNRQQNRTLAATRDLLLPKLMSGEIRVKDAERLVEQAA